MPETRTKQVDQRGMRFSAALTLVVLAVALILANPYLVAFQALMFAFGVGLGPAKSPYGLLYRYVGRKFIKPGEPEPEAPPRFAQGVGLAFTIVALIGYLAGATLFGSIMLAFALIAAFLNAVFGLCIGCEAYVLLLRLFRRSAPGAA
ncbi:DUF4395 domain-containing protein [Flindersiella endophytica]